MSENEGMGSVGTAIASLGTAITSPAKLAFIAYCVLAYTGRISTSRWEFLGVALLFFVIQVFHDDYARIWLNIRAQRSAPRDSVVLVVDAEGKTIGAIPGRPKPPTESGKEEG